MPRLPHCGQSTLIGKKKRKWHDIGCLFRKGRQKDRVEARDLVCYWASNILGISITDLAKTFGMTDADVSYAVRRGKTIAGGNKWQLSD